jgi:hypothetical protein
MWMSVGEYKSAHLQSYNYLLECFYSIINYFSWNQISLFYHIYCCDISVSIVISCRLDARQLHFDPWAEQEDFLFCTTSEVHPALYPVSAGDFICKSKAVTWNSPLISICIRSTTVKNVAFWMCSLIKQRSLCQSFTVGGMLDGTHWETENNLVTLHI